MSKKILNAPTSSVEIASEVEQLNIKIADLNNKLTEIKSQSNQHPSALSFSELTTDQIVEAALSAARKKNESDAVTSQLETAIAELQAAATEKALSLSAIDLEERAKTGLQQVKSAAKIAKIKLEEAKEAIASLQEVANIVGQDCLQVNGRIPFENRIDKSTGFLTVNILDNCVILEQSNVP